MPAQPSRKQTARDASPALVELEGVTRALFRVAAAIGQQAHKALGLGVTDLAALRALDQAAGENVRVGQLATALGLSSAATTELIDRLERAGLVQRERDPHDRRQVLLVLQPVARQVGEQLLAPWGRRIHTAAATLDEHDQQAVTRYLSRLLEDLPSETPGP